MLNVKVSKFQQEAIPYLLCHPSIFIIVATIATSTFVPFGQTRLDLIISLEMLLKCTNIY
jgi:hypothetical protein